jgi:hypothetical protein
MIVVDGEVNDAVATAGETSSWSWRGHPVQRHHLPLRSLPFPLLLRAAAAGACFWCSVSGIVDGICSDLVTSTVLVLISSSFWDSLLVVFNDGVPITKEVYTSKISVGTKMPSPASCYRSSTMPMPQSSWIKGSTLQNGINLALPW